MASKLTADEAEAVIRNAADVVRRGAARFTAKVPRTIGDAVWAAMPAVVAPEDRIREYDEAVEARKLRARAIEFWSMSGVPGKYRKVPRDPVWSDLPEEIGGRPVREPYRTTFSRVLRIESIDGGAIFAILGDRGPGKTWMGCCLIKRFCASGRFGMYVEALRYSKLLRSTFGDRGTSTELEVEAKHVRPELLVIDAMEEKGDSAFQQQELTSLVNARLNAEKITLIISNDVGQTLPDRIGRSLADRLNEGGGTITCDWPSLRGHVKAEVSA